MKFLGIVLIVVLAISGAAFAMYYVDVDQTQEGELPEVSVDGGQMPEYDADVGDIEVKEKEVTVEVPELEITPPEEEGADRE